MLHIAGLGAACALVERESSVLPSHLAAMRDELQRTLTRELGGEDGAGVRVNGPEVRAHELREFCLDEFSQSFFCTSLFRLFHL